MKYDLYRQLCIAVSYIAVFFNGDTVGMGTPYKRLDNKNMLKQCRKDNEDFLKDITLSSPSSIHTNTKKTQSPIQTIYKIDNEAAKKLSERLHYTDVLLKESAESPKQEHFGELVMQHALLGKLYAKQFAQKICSPGNNPTVSMIDLED